MDNNILFEYPKSWRTPPLPALVTPRAPALVPFSSPSPSFLHPSETWTRLPEGSCCVCFVLVAGPQWPTIVCLPWSREAMKAVATLLEHSSTAWLIWNFPSGIQPSTTAATAARNPTTVACTWVGRRQELETGNEGSSWMRSRGRRTCFKARFPMMRFHFSMGESIFPTLTWVRQ